MPGLALAISGPRSLLGQTSSHSPTWDIVGQHEGLRLELDGRKANWCREKSPRLIAHHFWGEVAGREAPFFFPTQSDEQGLA